MKPQIKGFKRITGRFSDPQRKIVLERLQKYINSIVDTFKANNARMEKLRALRLLNIYGQEIKEVIGEYNKDSNKKTMMIKLVRSANEATTERRKHQEDVRSIAVAIADGINRKLESRFKPKLNTNVIDIMAGNHDIGHTFYGHSGEWWLSDVKEKYGIGYYCHNAIGARNLIYRYGVYNKILDRIRQNHPDISGKTLNRIRRNLWLLIEGINSHNGERSEYEFLPDFSKTEQDFEREVLQCFTIKGFDRQIVPATAESALLRICDKASYVASDMADGLREGIITGLDDNYRQILRKMGITDQEIDQYLEEQDYQTLTKRIKAFFIGDIVANSTSSAIRMSKPSAVILHELRDQNNEQIVNFAVLREDNRIYPQAIDCLMQKFAEIIQTQNIVEQFINAQKRGEGLSEDEQKRLLAVYGGRPAEDFIHFITQTNATDFTFTTKMVAEVKRQSLGDNVSEAEMSNGIALEMGAQYLASLGDEDFIKLLRAFELINDTQYDSLTRHYGEDLKQEADLPSQWASITDAQKNATKGLKSGIVEDDEPGGRD